MNFARRHHSFSLAVLGMVIFAFTSSAHPLPNRRFDRTIYVRISTTGVTVTYNLELNDWTMIFDGKDLVSPREVENVVGPYAYANVYAKKKSPFIADSLIATLNSGTGAKSLTFRATKIELEPERDHLRVRYEFRADWTLSAARHTFQFADQNFPDRAGQVTLTLDQKGEGLNLIDVTDPADLRGKSQLDYKSGDSDRARRASAVFEPIANSTPLGTNPPPRESLTIVPQVEVSQPGFFELFTERGPAALFDTDLGWSLLLLLAAMFGAVHAFTPGHGKTMVAAFLVGERGTVKHALVLGLTVTATHTGSVIILALVTFFIYGNEPPTGAQGALTLVGGFLIFLVGLWLFLQRIRNRADHFHLFSGHDHHHHHHNDAQNPETASARGNFGWLRIVLLGVGGGIIPCWDAVLLFLVALSRGKVGLAIPMLSAFSVGLASVLVIIGIGVVFANRAGGRRFSESKWFKKLPVFSALVLMAFGAWFARDGWRILSQRGHDESRPAMSSTH